MAFFKKPDGRTAHQSPQPAAPPVRQPEPPPRVKYDRRETRKYVLDIADVRGPIDDTMQVLLSSKGEWDTLTKAQIDVKAELTDLRYGANYYGKSWFDEVPTYSRHLLARVTLRGFGGCSPLITFPPRKEDAEDPTGVYTAAFSEVMIAPHVETYPVTKDALPDVRLWDNFSAFDSYVGKLSETYQAAKKSNEPINTLWPTCVLNTRHSSFSRRGLDEASARSTIRIPQAVFDGLVSDMVSMGPKLSVYIQVAVEAYCLGWGTNYGYGEWDDHKWNYDLALVPYGSILTADIDRLRVQWKADGSTHDFEHDKYVERKETYLDNPDAKYDTDE